MGEAMGGQTLNKMNPKTWPALGQQHASSVTVVTGLPSQTA